MVRNWKLYEHINDNSIEYWVDCADGRDPVLYDGCVSIRTPHKTEEWVIYTQPPQLSAHSGLMSADFFFVFYQSTGLIHHERRELAV